MSSIKDKKNKLCHSLQQNIIYHLSTPLHKKDATQGQYLTGLNSEFSFS